MTPQLTKWMSVLQDCFRDCLTSMSEVKKIQPGTVSSDPIKSMCGPIIQVKVGANSCLQIGLHSDPQTQQFLGKLIEEDDPDDFLPDSDSSDAVGEILNIFVGQFVRTVFIKSDEQAVLTTPIFIYGQLDLPAILEFCSQEVQIDDHKVSIFIGILKVKQ